MTRHPRWEHDDIQLVTDFMETRWWAWAAWCDEWYEVVGVTAQADARHRLGCSRSYEGFALAAPLSPEKR